MRKLYSLALLFLFANAVTGVHAQNIKPSVVTGEVTSVSAGKIVLKQQDGSMIDIQLLETTVFKRVSPENPSLQNAVASNLSEIGTGDKIAATGIVAEDKKSVPARTVYLMTKADIAKKTSSETQAWQTRGISGRIVSLNPNTNEFTIKPPGIGAVQNIVVKPKDGVQYRRYARDSVKFDDAKPSSFNELQVGDQIRALGDKTADGAGFQAEQIISGAFKTVGGTVTAIDTAKNEVTIKEFQTNKEITIVVNQNSSLKRFPEEMANMMAARMSGTGGGAQPPQGAGGQGGNVMVRPPQQQGNQKTNQGQGAPNGMPAGAVVMRGGAGGGGLNVNDMFDRFPNISLADLKVGDSIAASSTSGTDASRVTAIKLVSGVEPFFRIAQMAAAAGAMRGGQGVQGGFSIPGLDGGFGTP